ncbi:MAG TPA: DUF4382 domain-containing protein [Gemmatimonadales bacterium]|jgi:hypothetical protein|nr:DUF4382 domain-containing protein [Gemmatimonadales bacterium]
MKRLFATFLVLAGTAGVACYQDDTLHPLAISPTKVFITDDPFPFDTVGSVNIYVTRIEASTSLDTTSQAGSFVTIATPNKSFDLLTLQQGATAFVGQGTIDAGKYAAIRMTIDVDRSSIKYADGSNAVVIWPYPHAGEIALYALVEQPLAVSATGGEIVIDFDVGRSFLYNFTGHNDFVMIPTLRAVNSATTGAIAGTVTGPDIEGNPTPIENANISVFGGDPSRFSGTWYLVATGRSDSQGHYQVSFIDAGSWIVQAEQPDLPGLAAAVAPSVQVSAGNTTHLDISLQRAALGSFINITGPSSVGFGGTVMLVAAVGDSNGIPEANPQVTWTSRNTAVAAVLLDSSFVADSLSKVQILGTGVGSTWIVASSGALKDSVTIQVSNTPPSNPVASIDLTPASMTIAKGDSNYFTATLRDSAGNVLTTPQISWFLTDSSGVATIIWASGNTAWIHANISGSTHLRAASESKFKDATITVP